MSKVRLRDYLESFGDGLHGTPEYDEKGTYYFINGNNLVNDKIVIDKNTLKISKEEYDRIKRPLGEKTILLSINGTLGKIAEYAGEPVALGKSVCYLNVRNKNDRYFVMYVMKTREFQKYILLVSHGSTIKNLAPSQVANYEFDMPDRFNIGKMSFLLKSIDKKIQNNNNIIFEIESISKTIYDYWFLQYDFPDENGKPYKSSGGKMVWNKELKREIPVDWRIETIEKIGDVVGGGTPSTRYAEYYCERGIGWITPYDLANTTDKYISHGQRDITEEGLKKSSATLLPKGTILMTSRAPIGYLAIASETLCTNQGFKSIVPKSGFGSEFVYYTILNVIPYIKSLGTGSTFTEVSKDVVSRVKIVVPPQKIHKRFENNIMKFSLQREALERENRELASLRNFLLPLLMNGQVGFRES